MVSGGLRSNGEVVEYTLQPTLQFLKGTDLPIRGAGSFFPSTSVAAATWYRRSYPEYHLLLKKELRLDARGDFWNYRGNFQKAGRFGPLRSSWRLSRLS